MSGLEVRNDKGNYVIDGQYRNLSLRYRRSFPASALASGFPPYHRLEIQIPQASLKGRPMFFIKASVGDRLAFQPMYLYQGNLRLEVTCWSNQKPQGPFEIFVFDDYTPASLEFGLDVFNDKGERVYNTAWPIMQIERIVNIPSGLPTFNGSNNIYTVSGFTDTSTIATGLSSNRTYYHGRSTGDGYSLMPAARRNIGSIDFTQVCFGSESEDFPGGGSVAFSGYLGSGDTTVIFVETKQLPPAPFGVL